MLYSVKFVTSSSYEYFLNVFRELYHVRHRISDTAFEDGPVKNELFRDVDKANDDFVNACFAILEMCREAQPPFTGPADHATTRHQQKLQLARTFASWVEVMVDDVESKLADALRPDIQGCVNALMATKTKAALWMKTLSYVQTTEDYGPMDVWTALQRAKDKTTGIIATIMTQASCRMCPYISCVRRYEDAEPPLPPHHPGVTDTGSLMSDGSDVPSPNDGESSSDDVIPPADPNCLLADPTATDTGVTDRAYSTDEEAETRHMSVGVILAADDDYEASSSSSSSSSSSVQPEPDEQTCAKFHKFESTLTKQLSEYREVCRASGIKPRLPIKSLFAEFEKTAEVEEKKADPILPQLIDQDPSSQMNRLQRITSNHMNLETAELLEKKKIPHAPYGPINAKWNKYKTKFVKTYYDDELVAVVNLHSPTYHALECPRLYRINSTELFLPGVFVMPFRFAETHYEPPRARTRSMTTCCGEKLKTKFQTRD